MEKAAKPSNHAALRPFSVHIKHVENDTKIYYFLFSYTSVYIRQVVHYFSLEKTSFFTAFLFKNPCNHKFLLSHTFHRSIGRAETMERA